MVDIIVIAVSIVSIVVVGLLAYITFGQKNTIYPTGTTGGTTVKGNKTKLNYAVFGTSIGVTVLALLRLITSLL